MDSEQLYREKIKSLGFRTQSKPVNVVTKLREDTGEVAGTQTEHWDGRVDANANLKVVTIKGEIGDGS